jgi:hypothetical protein
MERKSTAYKPKSPCIEKTQGLREDKSLTMTYFHTGIRTIIGAEAFHCPVRDGKEWYHLAMVIRHNGLFKLMRSARTNSQSRFSAIIFDCCQQRVA